MLSTSYGKPIEGSKTAARGQLAHQRVAEEVFGLCQIIKDYGKPCNDGTYFIFFGDLFQVDIVLTIFLKTYFYCYQ